MVSEMCKSLVPRLKLSRREAIPFFSSSLAKYPLLDKLSTLLASEGEAGPGLGPELCLLVLLELFLVVREVRNLRWKLRRLIAAGENESPGLAVPVLSGPQDVLNGWGVM